MYLAFLKPEVKSKAGKIKIFALLSTQYLPLRKDYLPTEPLHASLDALSQTKASSRSHAEHSMGIAAGVSLLKSSSYQPASWNLSV